MATLLALYKDRIYSSIYTLLRDKYPAAEIFQAVFMKIIDNMMAGQVIEEGKFLTYAMRLAHHLCLEQSGKVTLPTVYEQPQTSTSGLNKFVEASFIPTKNSFECHTEIRNMIDMLPEQQREVIILNHYGGLGFNEIADITTCSLNNALETMRFGLNNLRKLMLEKEFSV